MDYYIVVVEAHLRLSHLSVYEVFVEFRLDVRKLVAEDADTSATRTCYEKVAFLVAVNCGWAELT